MSLLKKGMDIIYRMMFLIRKFSSFRSQNILNFVLICLKELISADNLAPRATDCSGNPFWLENESVNTDSFQKDWSVKRDRLMDRIRILKSIGEAPRNLLKF